MTTESISGATHATHEWSLLRHCAANTHQRRHDTAFHERRQNYIDISTTSHVGCHRRRNTCDGLYSRSSVHSDNIMVHWRVLFEIVVYINIITNVPRTLQHRLSTNLAAHRTMSKLPQALPFMPSSLLSFITSPSLSLPSPLLSLPKCS